MNKIFQFYISISAYLNFFTEQEKKQHLCILEKTIKNK